jgi:hypothetical protein
MSATETNTAEPSQKTEPEAEGVANQGAEPKGEAQDKSQPEEGQEQPKGSALGGEGTPEEGKQPEGAPEQYELTTPEGIELDDAVRDKFADAAKKLNLTNDGAQGILDSVLPTYVERMNQRLEEHVQAWRDEQRKDPEIGGEKHRKSVADANAFVERLGTPELREWLKGPAGDQPELIRIFSRAARLTSEEQSVLGGGPVKEKRNLRDPNVQAEILYPDSE